MVPGCLSSKGAQLVLRCKQLTFILNIGVCCLQLQGDCNASRWLVDEDDQGVGWQRYMEREEPERHTWVVISRLSLWHKVNKEVNKHTWHKEEMCQRQWWVPPVGAQSLHSRPPLSSPCSPTSQGPAALCGSTGAGCPEPSGWTSCSSTQPAFTQNKAGNSLHWSRLHQWSDSPEATWALEFCPETLWHVIGGAGNRATNSTISGRPPAPPLAH